MQSNLLHSCIISSRHPPLYHIRRNPAAPSYTCRRTLSIYHTHHFKFKMAKKSKFESAPVCAVMESLACSTRQPGADVSTTKKAWLYVDMARMSFSECRLWYWAAHAASSSRTTNSARLHRIAARSSSKLRGFWSTTHLRRAQNEKSELHKSAALYLGTKVSSLGPE